MSDPTSEFLDALTAAGYRSKTAIVADDEWHRIFYQDERQSSGRYRLKVLDDGFAIGSFGSDKDPAGFHKWHSKAQTTPLTAQQRADQKKLAAEYKALQAEELARRQERIAGRLRKLVKAAPKAQEHGYLERKKVGAHGLLLRKRRRRGGDELWIPMYTPDGKVWNIQRVQANGWKGFWKGAQVLGTCYPIGRLADPAGTLVICEGFATGASIHEATGLAVRVAFNTANLKPLALALRAKYPEARIIICADNDRWTFKPGKVPANIKAGGIPGDDPRWLEWRAADLLWNPGLDKAQQAAVAIGGAVVIAPDFGDPADKPTDFNDLALREGAEAVKHKIMPTLDIRRPEPEPDDHDDRMDLEYGGGVSVGDPSEGYEQPGHSTSTTSNFPFKILGHNDGYYYFFPRNSGQIFRSSATGLASIANLFRLAPLEYWNGTFNSSGKLNSRKLSEFVANALIAEAHEVGVFRPQNIRGVGVWMDRGRAVVHCGDKLMVDGIYLSPHNFQSRYVYPQRETVFELDAPPLTNREAVKLREVCTALSWDTKLAGELLAGWIVIAPVSGALRWRPHIWVTGESQSGKTTVIEKIIAPLLDQISLRFDGGTSEAGIRQVLEIDGRPVLYDEAEAENQKDRSIMEGVLLLARRASNGGRIVKGGQSGDAVQYTINSAFCFSAINPAVKHRADESRISQLVLKRATWEGADAYYKELTGKIRQTFTPEYGKGLIARTIQHLPTLLHNAEVFSDAAAEVLCDRRAADQIGAMLAGLFLLTSTKRIQQDQAEEWIKKQDWTAHTTVAEQSDPERLITYISTCSVRYRGGDSTIGHLISLALGQQASFDYHGDPHDEHASRFLRDMGIWVRDDGVLFANKSPPLERLLKDTPWFSWSRPMMDIAGAEKVDPVKFATGLKSRGVLVPLEAFGL